MLSSWVGTIDRAPAVCCFRGWVAAMQEIRPPVFVARPYGRASELLAARRPLDYTISKYEGGLTKALEPLVSEPPLAPE